MIKIAFTDFKPTRITTIGEKITVTRSGFFSFSHQFTQKKIGNKKYVQLRYVKSDRIIGFLFTNDSSISGVLKLTKKGNAATVRSESFWKLLELDFAKYAGPYDPQVYEDDGKATYYIILKERREREEKT